MSMDYVRNRIGGYDEIGAGAFGLSIADRTFTSMGAKAGAMASFDIRSGQNTAIRAFGSVAYARELADTQDVVTAHFFGAADTPFTISNQLDPEWVSVNAGAEMQVGANLRASISVTSDMGRGVLSNDQAQASLSWRF
jgi:outer membrane autotransporter protein